MPVTIRRNQRGELARLQAELNKCRIYTSDNNFSGTRVDPAEAWERFYKDQTTKLVLLENGGTYRLRIHQNFWYELEHVPADSGGDEISRRTDLELRAVSVELILKRAAGLAVGSATSFPLVDGVSIGIARNREDTFDVTPQCSHLERTPPAREIVADALAEHIDWLVPIAHAMSRAASQIATGKPGRGTDFTWLPATDTAHPEVMAFAWIELTNRIARQLDAARMSVLSNISRSGSREDVDRVRTLRKIASLMDAMEDDCGYFGGPSWGERNTSMVIATRGLLLGYTGRNMHNMLGVVPHVERLRSGTFEIDVAAREMFLDLTSAWGPAAPARP